MTFPRADYQPARRLIPTMRVVVESFFGLVGIFLVVGAAYGQTVSGTEILGGGGGGGSGTVTSVGLSLPTLFTVSGSPVTTSGTLTGSLATQSANTLLAGPATGVAAAPTFRGLVVADIPALCPTGQVVNGASCTATPTLGASGTLGSLTLGNATSGLLTLEPTTGALGTSTIYLPVPSSSPDMVALVGTAQTFSGINLFSAVGTVTAPGMALGTVNTGFYAETATTLGLTIGGSLGFDYGLTTSSIWTISSLYVSSSSVSGLRLTSNTGGIGLRNGNTLLTSPIAAQLQFGSVNSASPIAQTLSFQGGSGTNIAGVNSTIICGGLSTGTGTDGDCIIQTGVKNGGSNSTPATATTALTLKGETQQVQAAATISTKVYTVSTLPTPPAAGAIAAVSDAVACTFLASLTGGGSAYCPVSYNGSSWVGG